MIWENIEITNQEGEKVNVQAPIIISASRSIFVNIVIQILQKKIHAKFRKILIVIK